MVPSGPLVSHGSPKLFCPGALGMSPPSFHVAPPSSDHEYPVRSDAAVSASRECCESLYPTATCDPETAIVVSLCVVWSSWTWSAAGSLTRTFVGVEAAAATVRSPALAETGWVVAASSESCSGAGVPKLVVPVAKIWSAVRACPVMNLLLGAFRSRWANERGDDDEPPPAIAYTPPAASTTAPAMPNARRLRRPCIASSCSGYTTASHIPPV